MDEDTLKPGDIVMLDPDYERIVNRSEGYKLDSIKHWVERDGLAFGVKYTVGVVNDSRSVRLREASKRLIHPGIIFRKVNDSAEHEDNLINIWNNQ